MWMNNLQEQAIRLNSENDLKLLKDFLQSQGLSLDRGLEYSMVLIEGSKIVGTGSFADHVLKCIAVDDKYKGLGLSGRIVMHLVNEQFRRGRSHLFIYTRPKNKMIFSELGFYPISEVPNKVVLMENRKEGIKKYLDELLHESGEIVSSAAVVVNCNPFTLGHRYLLEYAAAHCQKLHIFVVWEERSSFPAEVRYRLVKEGISHLTNVVIHRGKDYIISSATFPSYFIKEYDDLVETHAKLDLTIFSQHIAPTLKIEKRFIGEEPYCNVTSTYNKLMKEMLPSYGIEVEEIPRLAYEDKAISASKVRELLRQRDMQSIQKLVPETTYEFLLSPQSEEIIQRLEADKRH